MSTTPTIGSLCTGYGGLDLAAQPAFHAEVAWVADPAPGPAQLLAHRQPTIPNLGDIRDTDWASTPPIDILTAGFPCQPVSHCGRRAGTNDHRWLFDEILHAVDQLCPPPATLLFENVIGLLSASNGEAMRRVVTGLADRGYLVHWRVLRASDVGAPHQRARTFIAAHDPLRQRPRLGDRNPAATPGTAQADPPGPPDQGTCARLGCPRPPGADPQFWGRYDEPLQRWATILDRPAPSPTEPGQRGPRVSTLFLEWMMGLPQGWVAEVPGITPGQARQMLGNGVVPLQAYAAFTDLITWPHPASPDGEPTPS